ncbi:MAG TPA: DUF3347 domain-containing protein [Lacunisphaera sp.]
MKTIRTLSTLALAALLTLAAHAHDKNAPLNDEQKQFLSDYEAVHVALAADDLPAAKKAAAVIAEHAGHTAGTDKHAKSRADIATQLANADGLAAAREAFKTLSKQATHLADGQKGYYLAHCPMVPNEEGDWVQTTKKISNPYMGKAMATCGSIEN